MAKIWTIGEILVEIMRPAADMPLSVPATFRGPFPSGAPAIFADSVARLGGKSAIIGAVGDDDFGRMTVERLKSDGVDVRYVGVSPLSTGCAFVSYKSDGSRSFIFHMGNAACGDVVVPDELSPEPGDVLHVCGCSVSASPAMGGNILKVLRKFVAAGCRVSFDPNIRPELLRDDSSAAMIREVIDNTSYLLPGVGELLTVSGCGTVEEAVTKMFANPKLEIIALKDGSRGCRIYTRDRVVSHGIYEVEVLDATGAGDSFDAAFVLGMVEGKSVDEIAETASAAAALAVAGFGPMEGNVTADAVKALIGK